MSRTWFFEFHPVRWAEIALPNATTRRLADDIFEVQVEKWRPSVETYVETYVEPHPTPSALATFWLRNIAARDLVVERDAENTVEVRVTLETPMPDVTFRPDATLALPGAISFDDAIAIVASRELPVFVNGIREGRTYWFFPRFQIGSCGLFVAKHDGTVTDAGSAFPVDDWIWGYEHGLLECDHVDLCITRVIDIEATRHQLRQHLGLRPSSDELRLVERPPLAIPKAVNWMAIRWLRFEATQAFEWHVRSPNSRTA